MHKILRTTVVGISTWMHMALLGSLVLRPRPAFLSPNPNLDPTFPCCKQRKAGWDLGTRLPFGYIHLSVGLYIWKVVSKPEKVGHG